MKRLSIVLLFTVIIWTAFLAPALADMCTSMVQRNVAKGALQFEAGTNNNEVFAKISPSWWDRMRVRVKVNWMRCIARYNGVDKVYVFKMGSTNIVGHWDGKGYYIE